MLLHKSTPVLVCRAQRAPESHQEHRALKVREDDLTLPAVHLQCQRPPECVLCLWSGCNGLISSCNQDSPLKKGPNSPLTLSTTSSQAVEESLTQRPAASPPPPPIIPSDTPSPVRTQVQNYSHTPPQTVEGSAPDPSPPKLTPPLPRTRRGSKSQAAVGAQPTRVLRSRSKTPAPAPAPASQQTNKVSLPRRTRSTTTPQPEESADVNTGNGRRASAKPRSTSKPPSSGATGAERRTRANPGGASLTKLCQCLWSCISTGYMRMRRS